MAGGYKTQTKNRYDQFVEAPDVLENVEFCKNTRLEMP